VDTRDLERTYAFERAIHRVIEAALDICRHLVHIRLPSTGKGEIKPFDSLIKGVSPRVSHPLITPHRPASRPP